MARDPAEDQRSDEFLVAALNRGEREAFDVLYARYGDWAHRLAYRFTSNDSDALDVLQETFTYFYRKFPGFVLSAKLTTFLYPVVKHLAIAAAKRRRRFASDDEALESLTTPPTREESDSSRAELAAVLDGLSAGQREVVLLRFVDDFSLEEISSALDVPVGTVKSRLHNALTKLRDDPRCAAYFAS
ncbi:MAG: sigma-70 family RNA polymerase sigma factor [Planctomycetota bacterium]